MKKLKLNQKGIAHILAPILFIAVIAAIGGYVLMKSKAAPLSSSDTLVSTIYKNGRIYSGGFSLNPGSTIIDGGVKDLVPANSGFFPRRWSNMSFDGTQVAYVELDQNSGRNAMFVAKIDGNGKIGNYTSMKDFTAKYPWQNVPPVWSPNGSKLALTVHAESDATYPYEKIQVDRADGSSRPDLLDLPSTIHSFSAFVGWRPSSANIVYAPAPDSDGNDRICVISASSTGTYNGCRPLKNAQGNTIKRPEYLGETGLAIAPTGGKIALVAYNPLVDGSDLSSSIYIAKSDGSDVHRLTKRPAGEMVTAIVWSPDGKKIAYYLDDQRVKNSAYSGVYVINADGSSVRQISSSLHSRPESLSWPHS